MASNSIIERVFHTLKNEFGSVHVARDGLQLERILSSTIEAYMNRTYSAHRIYSPKTTEYRTSNIHLLLEITGCFIDTWTSEKNKTRRQNVFGSRVVAEAGLPAFASAKDWRTCSGC